MDLKTLVGYQQLLLKSQMRGFAEKLTPLTS